MGAKRDAAKLQVYNGVRREKKVSLVSLQPEGTGLGRKATREGAWHESGDPVESEAEEFLRARAQNIL